MKIITRLTIATLVLNLFIVIPYGGFLCVMEILCLVFPSVLDMTVISILSILTQIILLFSLRFKTKMERAFLIIPSFIGMWTILYFFIFNGFVNIFSSNAHFETTILLSSLPYAILSIILTYQLFRNVPLSVKKSESELD